MGYLVWVLKGKVTPKKITLLLLDWTKLQMTQKNKIIMSFSFKRYLWAFMTWHFNSLAIIAEVFKLIFKTNLFLQLAELQEFWWPVAALCSQNSSHQGDCTTQAGMGSAVSRRNGRLETLRCHLISRKAEYSRRGAHEYLRKWCNYWPKSLIALNRVFLVSLY